MPSSLAILSLTAKATRLNHLCRFWYGPLAVSLEALSPSSLPFRTFLEPFEYRRGFAYATLLLPCPISKDLGFALSSLHPLYSRVRVSTCCPSAANKPGPAPSRLARPSHGSEFSHRYSHRHSHLYSSQHPYGTFMLYGTLLPLMHLSINHRFGITLSPGYFRRRDTRLTFIALFEGWLNL